MEYPVESLTDAERDRLRPHVTNLDRPVFALGVDGWWPDEGDALNLPSRLVRNRMYWEGGGERSKCNKWRDSFSSRLVCDRGFM